MRALNSNPNVDNSDLINYPDGRIKDNDGTGNGTGVNEKTKGDWHQAIAKLMRLYDIAPNGLPDNESNGYQIIDAISAMDSKNDYIYPLTTDGTTLSVDIKLSLMKDNEFLVCLAANDKTTEAQIKGIGTGSLAIAYSGSFKANEYVRVIKTSSGVSIVRIADWNSLDAMVGELNYLKKASQAEENSGLIDTVATTPKVNKITFIKRVNGSDSSNYLATGSQDGLYPKGHFSIVAALGASPIKNVGWFSGLNIANSTGTLPVSGNVTAATATSSGSDSFVTVTMQNAMSDTNYIVKIYPQGESSNLNDDNDICEPVFKPISTTQFQIVFREITGNNQSLKINL